MVETSSEDHLMLLLIWYFEQLAFLEVRPHCIVDLLEHGGFDDEFSADPAKMGVASRGCTRHMIASLRLLYRCFAVGAVTPSFSFHQMVELRRSVAGVHWSSGFDSLVTSFAPNVVALAQGTHNDL